MTDKSLVEQLAEQTRAHEAAYAQSAAGVNNFDPNPLPTQPEPESVSAEATSDTPEPIEAQQPVPEPTYQQAQAQNWKEIRERNEQLARERDEALRYAKALELQAMQQRQPQQEEYEVDDDSEIDGRTMKIMLQRERQKDREELRRFQEQMMQQQAAATQASINAQMRATYNDWDQVVSAENVMKLSQLRPALAKSLAANGNYAEIAQETYQIIKDLGYHKPPQPTYQQPASPKKPRSMNQVAPQQADTPLNRVNQFTPSYNEDQMKELWKHMEKVRTNY